jgi:ATP-binding cassette, subfamily G (WHITE), member 2, PDR
MAHSYSYNGRADLVQVFDKVILLYEGRQIYFGKKDAAKQYFIDMGFYCPERATTADFLTSITSPNERQAREGWESRVPRTPDEFAARWRDSEDRARLLADIEEFDREYPLGAEPLEKFLQSRKAEQAKHQYVDGCRYLRKLLTLCRRPRSPYTISVPMQIRLCMTRGFQRLRGDMSLALSGMIGNFIMAMIIGSVFYNLPFNTGSFYSRGALLFFAILLNAFSSALEVRIQPSLLLIARKR